MIDDDDYDVWQENFGESLPAPSPSVGIVESSAGPLEALSVEVLAEPAAALAVQSPAPSAVDVVQPPLVVDLPRIASSLPSARPRFALELQLSLTSREDALAAWFVASELREDELADDNVSHIDNEWANEQSAWSFDGLDAAFESLALVEV
jgi:hypothetical protein